MNKRIEWLDTSKGLAIFLVVLGHSGIPLFFNKFILAFHMPTFFFVSGVVYNEEKYLRWNFLEFAIKKAKEILSAFFYFSLLNILLVIFNVYVFGSGKLDIFKLIVSTYIVVDRSNVPLSIALWFLPVMFLTQLIYFLLFKILTDNKKVFGTSILISILGLILSEMFNHYALFGLDITLVSLLFYAIGNFFKKQILSFINKTNSKRKLFNGSFLLLMPVLILSVYLNSEVVYFYQNSYGNPVLMLLSAASGSLLIFMISPKLKNIKFIVFLGKNSLIVYCVQAAVNYFSLPATQNLASKLTFVKGAGYLGFVINTILILMISILVVKLINQRLPFVIGRNPQQVVHEDIAINN